MGSLSIEPRYIRHRIGCNADEILDTAQLLLMCYIETSLLGYYFFKRNCGEEKKMATLCIDYHNISTPPPHLF